MSYCSKQPAPERPGRIECTPCACGAEVKAEIEALEQEQAS